MPYNADYYGQQQYYGPPYIPNQQAQPQYPPQGVPQGPPQGHPQGHPQRPPQAPSPQGQPQYMPLESIPPQHIHHHEQPVYQQYHVNPQGPPQIHHPQVPSHFYPHPSAQVQVQVQPHVSQVQARYLAPQVQAQFPPQQRPPQAPPQGWQQAQSQNLPQAQLQTQSQTPPQAPPQASHPSPKKPRPPSGHQQTPRHAAPKVKPTIPSKSMVSVVIPAVSPRENGSTEADVPNLLISLAEEYLAAASSNEMQVALTKGQAQPDDYYKLISTALGCMETALFKYRYAPVKEALLRLRYGRVLLDETDNRLDAENMLTKGVDLCERNKLFDLKYSIQVLLIKVFHRSRPKAAFKPLDGFIEDVFAYKHTSWEYVFRFLRSSLSLLMASHSDFVSGVNQLQKIMTLAQKRGDHSIFAFAAVTQALAHLRNGDADAVSQAQTALAVTRQFQLSPDFNRIPQLMILLHYVDLCCALQQLNKEQITQKLATMQQQMDQIVNDPSWQDDGEFDVPLTTSSATLPPLGGGIIHEQNGKACMRVSWLPKKDVYAVGFLLSAIAQSHKNLQSDPKTERYIEEGLAMIQGNMSQMTESHVSSVERDSWRQLLQLQFLLQRCYLQCGRTDWDKARQTLVEFKQIFNSMTQKAPGLLCLYRYLKGCIYQGTGSLGKALNFFLSPDLAIPSNCSKTSIHNIRRDIGILAAMNAILIIRAPTHPSHHRLPDILAVIEPYINASPNKQLLASRSLLISILPSSAHNLLDNESLSSTLLVKKHLGIALNIAKTIQNVQITAMTLSVMSDKFFKGVVGEQAEKSARAGQNMASKSGMKLWMTVSENALGETLERQGKKDEAKNWRRVALKRAGELPRELQRWEVEGGGSSGRRGVDREGDEDMDELA